MSKLRSKMNVVITIAILVLETFFVLKYLSFFPHYMLKFVAVVFLVIPFACNRFIKYNRKYKEALSLYNCGKYRDAAKILISLNDYRKSSEIASQCIACANNIDCISGACCKQQIEN